MNKNRVRVEEVTVHPMVEKLPSIGDGQITKTDRIESVAKALAFAALGMVSAAILFFAQSAINGSHISESFERYPEFASALSLVGLIGVFLGFIRCEAYLSLAQMENKTCVGKIVFKKEDLVYSNRAGQAYFAGRPEAPLYTVVGELDGMAFIKEKDTDRPVPVKKDSLVEFGHVLNRR